MPIILKANKINLFVSSVLFVFWYHSPNVLDTTRISNHIVPVRIRNSGSITAIRDVLQNWWHRWVHNPLVTTIQDFRIGEAQETTFIVYDTCIVAPWTRPPGTPLFQRCLVSISAVSATLLLSDMKTLNMCYQEGRDHALTVYSMS